MIHLRLKEIISHTGMKYEDFGVKIGFDVNAVRNMASERKTITPDIALEIERQFGVDPCWLIFGRGNMFPPKRTLGEELKSEDQKKDELHQMRKDIEDLKKLLTKSHT